MIQLPSALQDRPTLLLASLVALVGFAGWLVLACRQPTRKLPPGPKPWPIIGNLLDLPSFNAKAEPFYTMHRQNYGPISSLSVFGKTLVIINDADAMVELLDKRASKYSDRPRTTFLNDLIGLDLWGSLPHGDLHRAYRKMSHAVMGNHTVVEKWAWCMDVETRRYLLRLLRSPNKFFEHIEVESGAVILQITYGYTSAPTTREPMLDNIARTVHNFVEAAMPGRRLVDSIPLLKYMPEWMPGSGFKSTARAWGADFQEIAERPYDFAKEQMRQGSAKPSMVSMAFEKRGNKLSAAEEVNVK